MTINIKHWRGYGVTLLVGIYIGSLENSLTVSYKGKHIMPYGTAMLLLNIYPGERSTIVTQNMQTRMLKTAL